VLRILLAIALAAGVAHADDKPWAAGVPEEKQHAALDIYRDGNKLFEQDLFKDALPKYIAALALWDHPAIHYNAAVCLMNLDRPVEAYDHLQAALRFGAAPLGEKLYKDALDHVRVLGRQIAPLEVSCGQPDAKVTLDGADLLACPAHVEKNVLANDHQLVSVKPGYQTDTRTIHLEPGKKTTLVIELKPTPTQRKLVRRWNRTVPWYVIAGGGVVAVAGFAPLYFARSNIDEYDSKVTKLCPMGCARADHPELQPIEDRAKLDFNIARGMFVAGGAIAVIGFSLVVLNQPHLEHAPAITPSAGPDHVGVIISGRW
jgi:hypothetical protein